MRLLLLIALAALMATEAGAIEIDSVFREITYTGGLENPDMMGDTVTSEVAGVFNESFSDLLNVPPNELAGADVSQLSNIEIVDGTLFINAAGESGAYVTTLAGGLIADAYAASTLAVIFSTSETMRLNVSLSVSSSLGIYYDGPGEGQVGSSHFARILLCLSGVGCLADTQVEDLSDNGLAVADGVSFNSVEIPPGTYQLGLIASSEVSSVDQGSTLGGADFSGYVWVEPVPEPGQGAMLVAEIAFLVTRRRRAARAR